MKITQLKESDEVTIKKMEDWIADHDGDYDAHDSYISDNYKLAPESKSIVLIGSASTHFFDGVETTRLPYKFVGNCDHFSLKNCKELEILHGVPKSEAYALIDIPLLTSLRGLSEHTVSLNIHTCGIQDLSGCPASVKKLKVVNCDDLKSFSGISKHLDELTIDLGDITEAMYLPSLVSECRKLTFISWSKNAPEDIGLLNLLKIKGLKKLEVIGGGMIGKAGKAVKIIAEHLGEDVAEIVEYLHDANLSEFAHYEH